VEGSEVSEVVLKVLQGRQLPEGMNNTFINLIPKTLNPKAITQFRPIDLCNVTYRLVTKCLVNRMKHVLPGLISPWQSSFVPVRQIGDNIIVMQEILHSMRRKTGAKGWIAIKLDLEKAYDRLNWGFLHHILMLMGLRTNMINTIIINCVTSCRLNNLWNGEPVGEFEPTSGIRQGDPLSPHLFVACMERLALAIEEECRVDRWKPIQICREGPKVAYLMFANDVVLLSEVSRDHAQGIMEVLSGFCPASGQKVNL